MAAAAALVFAACTGGSAPRPAPSSPPPAARTGGSVVVGVLGEPASLDPHSPAASEGTWTIARAVYPSLFALGPDGVARPSLARSLAASPSRATVALRRARWGDGSPITAADVVASIARAHPRSGLARISSARRVGRRAVELRGEVRDWETALATVGFVLPGGRAGAAAGGPFAIARKIPGLGLTLRRNPAWWGPPAYLRRIVVRYVASTSTLIELLDRGRIDVASLPSSLNLSDRLAALDLPHARADGWERIVLDLRRSGLTRTERLGLLGAVDLRLLEATFLRTDGDVAWARGPGGALAPAAAVLAGAAGDELVELLQRGLYTMLVDAGTDVDVVAAEQEDLDRAEVGGAVLRRMAGAPGVPAGGGRSVRVAALFDVATMAAWRPRVHGVRPNPTFDGLLWNAHRWWVGP